MWPFEKAMVTSKPTYGLLRKCHAHYEAVQYAQNSTRRTGIDGAGARPAGGVRYVCTAGILSDRSTNRRHAEARSGGSPQSPPSGHAMLMVGYDLSDKTYLVRNSWGAGWADQGYCKIPFETIDNWARPEDFWTIGAIEQASGCPANCPARA